ncbi:LytE LysM repeat protein [Pyrenophora tritici-repentis]|nr:LytE LysM repeat protein [Pyrenophora tritici-repentis]KAI1541524.1 LysM domain containing protein [Pyrenophora tritici-repentis]
MTYLPLLLLALFLQASRVTATSIVPHIHSNNCACKPGMPLGTGLPGSPNMTIPAFPVTSIMGSMTVSFKPFGSTAAVSAPSAAPGTATITIKPGDTLESITKANNVGICDLVKANEIVDPDMVLSGETLVVPNEKGDPGDMSCLVHEY